MSKLRLENINKYYKSGSESVHALKDVTMEIDEGELLAVMGRSGSGKSTLLKVLGGLTGVDSGSYYYNNKLLTNREKHMSKFRNQHIGFIVQSYALLYDRTVFENIELPLKYSGMHKKHREDRVMEVLQQVGLEDYDHRFPHALSGGECQRVAIARAIINNPGVILADEPTGALDEETEEVIMDIFRKLNEDGKTIIVVTHDPSIAKKLHRVVYLRNGMICE